MPDNQQQQGNQGQGGDGSQQGNQGGAQQQQQSQKSGQGQQGGQQSASYETWLAEQPEAVRAMLDGHIGRMSTLEKTLETVRSERKSYEKQFKEAASQLEEGSTARKTIEEQLAKLQGADKRANFMEEATAQGVTNARLAWLASQDHELINGHGKTNWEELKKVAPEVFFKAPPAPPGGAGAGRQAAPPDANFETTINQALRQARGIQA